MIDSRISWLLVFIVRPLVVTPIHLHHFVTQMIDHLHGDAAGFWFVEGAGGVAVEGLPGFFVDLAIFRYLPEPGPKVN
jgi:hypothetical protein